MATSTDKINVAVVGGGIAGLTAALRLAQNGCKVTVYEKNATVGGNLGGAQDQHGKFHDVYPHMFGDWYNNFWKLVAELGLSLEHDFDPQANLCLFEGRRISEAKTFDKQWLARERLGESDFGHHTGA